MRTVEQVIKAIEERTATMVTKLNLTARLADCINDQEREDTIQYTAYQLSLLNQYVTGRAVADWK